jgi:hypothetical protein
MVPPHLFPKPARPRKTFVAGYTSSTPVSYDDRMKWSRSLRKLGDKIEVAVEEVADSATNGGHHVLRTVGWVSAGVVTREIRQRYKFNRRTPYDFYAHSGDQATDVEFGVGI